MQHDEHEPAFDDPDLKAALRRGLGAERAPVALRDRVVAAIQAERRRETVAAPAPAIRHVRWQRPLAGLAAAAILLIGFGIAYTLLWNSEGPAPQWFAAAMVQTHDGSLANIDPKLLNDIPANDTAALRGKLYGQLGYHVAPRLGDDWKLVSAGISQVRSARAAQMVYTRGDQTVSVFSIPIAVLSYSGGVPEGMRYSQVEQGHPVSGFVHDNAVHCLVASSKSNDLDLKTLTAMREQVRRAFDQK